MNTEKAAGVRKFIVEHGSELEDTSLSVGDLGHWSEGDEEGHFIREVTSSVLRECAEHLSGTLRVANVSDFLSVSLALDGINYGGKVIGSHLKPGEVPELLLVVIWVVLSVGTAISVTARVAKPHIVASASGDEGGSDVGVVDDPAVGGVEDSMLEEHGWLAHV